MIIDKRHKEQPLTTEEIQEYEITKRATVIRTNTEPSTLNI